MRRELRVGPVDSPRRLKQAAEQSFTARCEDIAAI
jgi:hypothetical protein